MARGKVLVQDRFITEGSRSVKYPVPLLHLVLSLDVGGLEVLVVSFLRKTNTREYRPLVCCLDSKGVLAGDLEREGIEVCSLLRKPGFDIGLVFRLASLMKERRIGILHTHNWSAHLYGSLAARLAKVPVVIHTQHGKLTPYTWKKRLLAPMIGRMIDRFVGVSNDISEFAKISGWVPQKKIQTILNGIDIEPDPSTSTVMSIDRLRIRKELRLPLEATVIVNVARLSEIKDHFTLLNAFSYLKELFDPLFLVVVGDGPLMEKLRVWASELKIEECVIFTGMRRDVPLILSAADIFALSSKSEGIAVSLIEAMRAGLPVVATDVGGNREVVQPGETGLLVAPEQPETFAAALGQLVRNPSLRKIMGEKGRLIVRGKFSLNNMMAQYMAVYSSILIKKSVHHR